ncbi:MAG: lipid-A-disaccharide synthase [Cytophagales bacterium]|nr:lipid-A-disaccharide synthase [Cytophagales bacterium]
MKYYIIAGESSGDLHASNLMKEIKKGDTNWEFRCCGGDTMKKEGATLAIHNKELSFMGILEVAAKFGKVLRLLKVCKRDILRYKPDVLILVDFAGFNMRVAKFAKKHRYKVFYYISPKVWAWNQSRVFKIKKLVDRMFVIFPFEKEFYKKFDYQVDYVGNPTLDAVSGHQINHNFRQQHELDQKPILAILPGSRRQEIKKMLPFVNSICKAFGDYHIVVAAVSNVSGSLYEQILNPIPSVPRVAGERRNEIQNLKIVYDQTYDLLAHSEAALVTSGTATLETSLLGIPHVVCYKTSVISYLIVRLLIKVKYISLENLIAGKEIVKELIQQDYNLRNIIDEFKKVLFNPECRNRQIEEFKKIGLMLGEKGASAKAASLMVKYLAQGA